MSLLAIAIIITLMIIYISEQTVAMEQARELRELRKEKESLENKQQLLASQVALLEKSERIHRLASQELAMSCPSSPEIDLRTVHFADAERPAPRTERGIAVLASGIIRR
jgi:cell division protein FtsL